ncbi:MAG: hypothetical protein WBF87_15200 [Mesorhizobium sp.]
MSLRVIASAWLAKNFLKVGIAALATDLTSRFYYQVGMNWLLMKASERSDRTEDFTIYPQISTMLDLLTSFFWGLFSLGFALRVLSEFVRLRDERGAAQATLRHSEFDPP